MDKLATLGKMMGKNAIKGGITGGIKGAVQGNQNPNVGTSRGAGYGALGGAVGGATTAGMGGLMSPDKLGTMAMAPASDPSPGLSMGQKLIRGAGDLMIGEKPLESTLGTAPVGTDVGVLPHLMRQMGINVPIGKRRRVRVQPFGRSGLTGRGIRVANNWR
jgi:hypothetical protein